MLLRHVAAGNRAGRLVAAGRQPLAVLLHLLAGVDGRQRRRNPARLQRVRRVGAGAHLHQPELLARREDDVLHLLALGIQAPDFEPGCAGHAVPERADLLAPDGDVVHVEELDVRNRPAVQLFEQLPRVRPLHLVAVVLAHDRGALRVRRRAVVAARLHVEPAGLGVELHPVHGRRAAHEVELVFAVVEHDHVADDVAVVAARRELLGLVRRVALEGVRRQVRQHLHRVRTGDEQFRHVVRLVEQHRGIAPRLLLAAPVAVLGRHHGIHVGANLRVPQHLDGVAGLL